MKAQPAAACQRAGGSGERFSRTPRLTGSGRAQQAAAH
eukprot:CAMPEP_0119421226 /NCGR_PEP_ID=MMETSP1335-20130426/25437_1 /TAXON_ID=259385 /ORGANISM="Chrysoculter rhomboideus, Strain RCC1486" /LENGTH=37 /DNA_ID= /DNA_START= /DNA_END= /DNA_ORIENTATION=